MKNLIATIICSLCFFGLSAQDGYYNHENKRIMEELSIMVGDWEGSGWAMNSQTRVKEEFTQTEEIRFDLDSTIIKVRGIGKSNGSIIHDAIAIISPNLKGGFFMTSFLGDGRDGKYELTGSNGNYVWKIPTPQGIIIYTITITDNTWKEVGGFEMNGQLYPFFEMNLKKTKS